MSGHTSWVSSIAFAPAGQWIASGSWDKTVRFWHPDSGRCLNTLFLWYGVLSISTSATTGYLATAGVAGNLCTWRVEHTPAFRCMLMWSCNPATALTLKQLNISQSIGFTAMQQLLCKHNGGAVGKFAPLAQPYRAWCTLFQPIPGTADLAHSSVIRIPTATTHLSLSQELWIVTVARRMIDGRARGSRSSSSQHTFLIIEGIKK